MSELLAYTPEQVCRLTGLTRRQLRYWDKTDFFSPEQVDPDSRYFGKLYSFRDLVGLRAIAILRERVSLQELRKIGEWLAERYDSPWASIKFWVVGTEVVFREPDTHADLSTKPLGQRTWSYEMREIAESMRSATDNILKRSDEEIGSIDRNRFVARNAHVLAGTRIPTRSIWNLYEAGYGEDDIVREYPSLTPKDVRRAVEFEQGRRQAEAG